jgi:hypothetical protein
VNSVDRIIISGNFPYAPFPLITTRPPWQL